MTPLSGDPATPRVGSWARLGRFAPLPGARVSPAERIRALLALPARLLLLPFTVALALGRVAIVLAVVLALVLLTLPLLLAVALPLLVRAYWRGEVGERRALAEAAARRQAASAVNASARFVESKLCAPAVTEPPPAAGVVRRFCEGAGPVVGLSGTSPTGGVQRHATGPRLSRRDRSE